MNVAPICASCRHFTQDSEMFVCDAFPDGIPSSVINYEADHRRPIAGDHGIKFEQGVGLLVLDDIEADRLFSGGGPE